MSATHMRVQPRWSALALGPLATGLVWLLPAGGANTVLVVAACVAGVPLLATGTALLVWPGDRQITHYLAVFAIVSIVIAVVCAPWRGWSSLALVAGGGLSFWVAGRTAVRQAVLPRAVPLPPLSLAASLKAGADEALLGLFIGFARLPRGAALVRDATELAALERRSSACDPQCRGAGLHAAPDAPSAYRLVDARSQAARFQWLRFDSGYQPDPALPGAARWRGHIANRRMAARIFEHPGRPRPWLICIHGYRMGMDRLDLALFRANRLHHTLGLNVAMPILPLHGARRIARVTGGHYFDGPLADLMHAAAQGLWDLRRLKAWISARQPGEPIGALGYSLGGYHAALLAAFEADLACVIAGIPLTDIARTLWLHMPTLQLRYMETHDVTEARLRAALAPVSPLQLAPIVTHDRRYIFAATADQLVDPAQPLRLWQHWDRPAMRWYDGSHLSVRREAELQRFVERALQRHGLIAA